MNKKGLLIYDKRVSWDFYVKCVNENWQSNINEIEDTKCEDRFSSDELENLRYNDSEDGTLFEELI